MSAQAHGIPKATAGIGTVQDLVAQNAALTRRNARLEAANQKLRLEMQRLERLAYLDPLTGLGNRRHFDAVAASELRRAARTGEPLTVLICDVDEFKNCNDLHGHEFGDAVLMGIARILEQFCRRGGDIATRYAGDEFALLMPGVQQHTAQRFADQLRAAVCEWFGRRCGTGIHGGCVTLSIGGNTFQKATPCTPAELLEAADRALFRAKRAGRNRTAFANGTQGSSRLQNL